MNIHENYITYIKVGQISRILARTECFLVAHPLLHIRNRHASISPRMKIIAEVKKQGNESGAAIIRRFTKRVQGTKALMKVREERYHTRKMSTLKMKRRALVSMDKRKTYDRLKKLGKIADKIEGSSRR